MFCLKLKIQQTQPLLMKQTRIKNSLKFARNFKSFSFYPLGFLNFCQLQELAALKLIQRAQLLKVVIDEKRST